MGNHKSVGIVFATKGDRQFDQLQQVEMLRNAGASFIVSVMPHRPVFDLTVLKEQSDEVLFDDGLGQAHALAIGLESIIRSGVKFWNWSNDDDRVLAGAYTELAKVLDSSHSSALAFGNCSYVNEKGSKIASSQFGRLAIKLLDVGPDLIPSPSSLMRVSMTSDCGGMRVDSGLAVDYDLFLRLKKHGEFIYVNKDLAEFGWTKSSRTRSQRMRSSLDASRARIRSRGLLSPLNTLEPLAIAINYLGGKALTVLSMVANVRRKTVKL